MIEPLTFVPAGSSAKRGAWRFSLLVNERFTNAIAGTFPVVRLSHAFRFLRFVSHRALMVCADTACGSSTIDAGGTS
jgi:hypothetical protein